MPDALRILLNAQLRHWLLIFLGGALVHRFGFADEVLNYLRDTNLDYVSITLGIGAGAVGVWTRWRAKLKQKIALQLPAGTPERVLKAEVSDQPLTATLRATPTALVIVLASCLAFTSCASAATALRQNVETIDFKAGYGGGYARARVHLRPPDLPPLHGYAK